MRNNIFRALSVLAPVIVIALSIGFVTAGARLYEIRSTGSDYHGVLPSINDDDLYYEARAQEARDGFPFLGNPYIYELRDAPSVSFWIPDATLSLSGQALKLSVQQTILLFDFILPSLLFLLTYAILFTATRSRLVALLGAAFFHLGLFVDAFARSPSPQFNFIFVEIALYAGLLTVQRFRYAPIALALALGSLFYIYPYFWTFTFGCIGMFLIASLVRKNLRPFTIPILGALCAATIIGLPSLLQTARISHSTAYQETLTRLGLIISHTPNGLGAMLWAGAIMLLYIGALWRFRSLRADAKVWFFSSAVVGGITAANNQFVTGRNLEFSSHYYLPVAYISFLAGTYLLYRIWLEVRTSDLFACAMKPAIVGIIICSTSALAASFVIEHAIPTAADIEEQSYGDIFSWLRTHTAPESVVFAGRDLREGIPAYTSDRVFFARGANLHVMTDEENWTRFLLAYWDAKYDTDFLQKHVLEIWGVHPYDELGRISQLNKLRKLLHLAPIPAELLPASYTQKFSAFIEREKKLPVSQVLGDRRIDYAIAEPDSPLPSWMKKIYPDMQQVYSSNGFTVYELHTRKQ